jgi:colicin import membrane protein
MARSGISYEEVAAVAERLVTTGATPTHRAIRMELGTGSANTIHRHLTQWLAQRAERPAPAPSELPVDVARSITAALSAAAAAAKSTAAEELARAVRAADDLADEGAKLEAELTALQEQVRLLTSDADALRGRCAEQATELARLRAHAHEVEQARARSERELAVAVASRASSEERQRESVAREQATARELAELRTRVEQVLEHERDALSLAVQREGQLRAELAARDSDLRAAQQAQVAAIERAKLQWQLETKATPKGKP